MSKKDKSAVPLDMAEEEFQRFADNWGFKTESRYWDQDTVDGFNEHKERVVNAIVDGRATLDGGLLSYTPEDGGELVFKRPNGRGLLAMDSHKDQQSMHKLFQFIGSMTGTNPKVLANYEGRDLKFVMAVSSLFLGG